MFSLRRPGLRCLTLAAVLALAIGATYAYSLRGDFLWDDDLHITANPTIIGPLGLKEIWTSARANYFPLVLTSFKAQHALWGVEPLGYRIVTLACHILAALALWQVLRLLRVPGAWLGATLWALHPVQVESVAWICELKNTQSAVFFLGAVWCWLRWLQTDAGPSGLQARSGDARLAGEIASGRWFYAGALIGAVAAILSKPSTVMLPVALGLCSVWVRGRIDWRDARRLLPFFALSGLAAGWTIWEQKYHSGAIGAEWSHGLAERCAIAGRVVWFYLGKLIWPEPLIFIYPRWQIDVSNPLAWVPALAALAAGFFLWRVRRGRLRALGLFAAYFVALLFPVLGFFNVYFFRYSFVGDHFQYLASMGPLAVAGALLVRLGGRLSWLAGATAVIAFGLISWRESRSYLNNEALWRDTVSRNPAAVMAWLNLADTLAQAQRYEEAMATYRRALEIKPTDPYGWNDLGNLLVIVGRPAEAIPLFERALTLKPDYADVHSNHGRALQSLGRSDEAIAHYRRALALKPTHTGALNNLGAELAERGQPAEALELFEQAARLKPGDAATLDNLAGALRGLGRIEEAITQHREAIRLKPESATARANFGRTLLRAGRAPEAVLELEKALQLKPTLASARGHYAMALSALGRPAEAMAQLERAVELSPESAEAQVNLGTALAQAGRTEAAVDRFAAAVRLQPGFATAHANLGTALCALRRWAEAIPQLEQAVTLQPEAVAVRAQLAVALVNHGRLADAVPHFQRAVQLDPQATQLREHFGQVLDALGRKREAFEQLEEAARLRRTLPR